MAKYKIDKNAIYKLYASSEYQRFANQVGAAVINDAKKNTAVRTGNLRASWTWEVGEKGVILIGSGPVAGRRVAYAAAYLYGRPGTTWRGNNVLWNAIEKVRDKGVVRVARQYKSGRWHTVWESE